MTELMDEHIDWEVVPLGLKRHGIDEMRQLIEGSWADYSQDGWHEITNVFASEDWVRLEYTARGTITKELAHLNLKYSPKGQKKEIRAVDVCQGFGLQCELALSVLWGQAGPLCSSASAC